jgi:tetratricopeptide (TPR) repeat protein
MRDYTLLLGLGLLLTTQQTMAQSVEITRKPLVLPTYEVGAPDVDPIFFTGRVYQGAQGHIYPYQLIDGLSDKKVDKTYDALYLDNEYLRVCVLPEIGGRILSATDKTDNYDIFYRQTGIKPALIGMLGAWLSGGVEWNIPHHHRPSSFMPIDWKTEENPDGSKTIWVGETELRHRMKWSVGITVYPNRSWVEARVRLVNRSPFVQSFLYWANVSVHCNQNYEVIFPPSTQFGADHFKVYFTRWPMGEATPGSGENVNLGMWKNFTGVSRSIFAWNFEDNFLAGYDHGKNAGTVHVANRHIVGGKKFFLWGNNSSARMWDKMLSDNDGPYLELMVGAYSDNQPDYSWIGPGETREFTQRWYGIRDIRSVKNATDNAAMNLEREKADQVFLGFNATTKYPDAKIVLKAGDKRVFEKTLLIDPAHPFTTEVKISKAVPDTALFAALYDKDGNELVSYRPVKLAEKPLPKVIDQAKPVKDYKTVEELYYAGLRVEQFHNARLNAMDFYEEALRRDSMDSRVNTVVGIHYARGAQWDLAEKHLLRALMRPTKDYTTVKDPEPWYYLGLTYQMQGRLKEASDAFWKATWYPTFEHPAYLALAQIDCLQGLYPDALDVISRSLDAGGKDTKALTTKAYILRMLGRGDEAKPLLEQALKVDPLDYWSLSEQSILAGRGAEFLSDAVKQRGKGLVEEQELMEMACDYARLGAYKEAEALTAKALALGEPYQSNPLIHYYNGYFNSLLGKADVAEKQWQQGEALTTDGSFPFRLEEANMFSRICQLRPKDASAAYYLGNLYYFFGQEEKGIACWEQAVSLNGNLAQAYRNLGFGYNRHNQLDKAIAAYEKAIACNNQDARYLRELDALYERAKRPAAERLKVLEANMPTVLKHDDDVMRLLTLYNETGQYDKATAIMNERHFHVWEGGGEIHGIYADSHLLKGMNLLGQKSYDAAIKEFALGDEYPANLEVGRPDIGGHSAKAYYYMGKAYQALGNKAKAAECFKVASTGEQRKRNAPTVAESLLFNGLSLKEMGRTAEGDAVIKKLSENIDSQLEKKVTVDASSKFGEDGTNDKLKANLYYLKGLVACTQGRSAEGKPLLQKALELNPDLIWAKQFMTQNF